MVVYMTGAIRTKATAALIGPGNYDTRQVGVDNSLIVSMAAMVGAVTVSGTSDVIP